MKKLYFLLLLTAIVSFVKQANAMDTVDSPKKMDTTSVQPKNVTTLISAQAVLSRTKNDSLTFGPYLHSNANPLVLVGKAKATVRITESQVNAIINNLAKNDPQFQNILNDPNQASHFREYMIAQLTQGETGAAMIPAQYLSNKKPEDIIFYNGYGTADNQNGLKISENEGTQVIATVLHSPNPTDFTQEAPDSFVSTKEFAKDANKAMREFEDRIVDKEARFGRAKTGDKYGITSGWNGGKSLMDTEKREASSRPK